RINASWRERSTPILAVSAGEKQVVTTLCHFRGRSDRVCVSGDHGSKYRVEVIGPGRQDWFLERNPVSGAPPHLWHRSFPCLRQSNPPPRGSPLGLRLHLFSREERRARSRVLHSHP